MSTMWSVIVGFIVTIITYFLSQWDIEGKWAPIGTALKGLIAIVVSFILAIVQGLCTGAFLWKDVWTSLPIIVGVAMGFYGVIIKPIDKAINAPTTAPPSTTTETTPTVPPFA
jgi:membrane-associated PAP2 superfamily phosphatase